MQIIYKNIKELKPYANNPRDNKKAIAPVVESIKAFGFRVPIIIDERNVIVAGHTRYEACKVLGITDIPTITADGLTEDQIKAFRVVDNKTNEYAKWDENLLRIELGDLEIDLTPFDLELFQEPQVEIIDDKYDIELPDEPKSKHGDIYLLGNHRLMCGDSTIPEHVEKLMGGNSLTWLLLIHRIMSIMEVKQKQSTSTAMHSRTGESKTTICQVRSSSTF